MPLARLGWVLKGSAIDCDGTGLAVTTEQCLLNPNRNPRMDRAEVESHLRRDLGIERVLWFSEGLMNDHTDIHVDVLARWVAPGVLALPVARRPTTLTATCSPMPANAPAISTSTWLRFRRRGESSATARSFPPAT